MNKGQTMQTVVRAIAVCLGVIFVVFGGLMVATGLTMMGQGPNAAKVGVTVEIVAIVIFALVAIAGVFLIWLGLRRETRTAPVDPGVQHSPEVALGQFIARCGPEKNGEMYNYISAGVYVLIALVCVVAPGLIDLKIDPTLAAQLSLIPAGIGVAAALLHVWTPLFGAPQTIELYEHGIVERLGKKIRHIEWAAIEKLRLQEWYEHRFAAQTFNVKAQIHGQGQLSFSTALRGDAQQIVEYLTSKIPQTEIVEFNATM